MRQPKMLLDGPPDQAAAVRLAGQYSSPLPTREPGLTTVVTAMLTHNTCATMVVESIGLPWLPLQYGKPEARLDTSDHFNGRSPAYRPFVGDDIALKVTPVHLNTCPAIIESICRGTDGAPATRAAGVPSTFDSVSIPLRWVKSD